METDMREGVNMYREMASLLDGLDEECVGDLIKEAMIGPYAFPPRLVIEPVFEGRFPGCKFAELRAYAGLIFREYDRIRAAAMTPANLDVPQSYRTKGFGDFLLRQIVDFGH